MTIDSLKTEKSVFKRGKLNLYAKSPNLNRQKSVAKNVAQNKCSN